MKGKYPGLFCSAQRAGLAFHFICLSKRSTVEENSRTLAGYRTLPAACFEDLPVMGVISYVKSAS